MKNMTNILPMLVITFGATAMAMELNIDCHNNQMDGLTATAGGIINTDESNEDDLYGPGVPAKGTISMSLYESTHSGKKRWLVEKNIPIEGTYTIDPHGQRLSAVPVNAKKTVMKEMEINTAVTEISYIISKKGNAYKMACSIEHYENN